MDPTLLALVVAVGVLAAMLAAIAFVCAAIADSGEPAPGALTLGAELERGSPRRPLHDPAAGARAARAWWPPGRDGGAPARGGARYGGTTFKRSALSPRS